MEALDSWLRVGAFAVGFLGVVVFFHSILRVALLNRRQKDWLATQLGIVISFVARQLARRRRDYNGVQKTMDWAFPIYNLTLVAVWFLLVQTSFALMIWALEVDRSWLKAFIASGSALSTLGFATPSNPVGQLLGVLEGAMGLGIVVFIFTFIPGYRAAVVARENMVGWLYARVGARPTAFSLVEWSQIADQSEDMTPIWNDGESWFRNLLETHSRTPLLALVPSVYFGGTWIGAAAVILDAASFALSSQKVKGLESARLCHEIGLNALRQIARELPGVTNVDTAASDGTDNLVAAFDAAYEKFVAAGVLMKPDRDECRHSFLNYRSSYQGLARGIAMATLMPIDEPWLFPQRKVGRLT
jgi:hypothetical protein